MSLGKSIALLTAGAAAGISFIWACGNEPHIADAAVCDCPAAEAPLTADRYMFVDTVFTIPANDVGGNSAVCPDGTLFLAGSCTTAVSSPVRRPTLSQSGFYGAGTQGKSWSCQFKNDDPTPVDVKASVICLKPAP
jgi:hypothetical protein